MYYVAPAGTPINLSDLAKLARRALTNENWNSIFIRNFGSKFNFKYNYTFSSGRAAICHLLKVLKDNSDSSRNEIIIPSYTCYSVPGSILKAGLKVRVCDIDPTTLSYDLEKLQKFDFSHTLGIMTSNLYGIPNDLPSIERIATDNSILLIDDAAQSMGATINERFVGSFGDIGIYSLDKGKNITTIQGGILSSNNLKLSSLLSDPSLTPDSPSFKYTSEMIIKLLIYKILLPPRMYWLTKLIPFSQLGKTIYTTEYPVTELPNALASFADIMLEKLDHINACRINNAHFILDRIDNRKITPIKTISGANPVYTRLPLLAESQKSRTEILNIFNTGNISATLSYPKAITDIPEIQNAFKIEDKNCEIGRDIADRLFTVPTHPLLHTNDLIKITATINK